MSMGQSQPDWAVVIANELHLKPKQTRAALDLLNEGNTIPFIARYRKEMTGELDEQQLREIAARFESHKTLDERKQDVIRLLGEQGVFEDAALAQALTAQIRGAKSLTEVEDLYRPYRPKRKTRASVARERGLEGLAAWLRQPERAGDRDAAILAQAEGFVDEARGVSTSEEALLGARDIIAELVADDPQTRAAIRNQTRTLGRLVSQAVDPQADSVYELYYAFEEAVSKLPPHRVLAMNRGEREGFLKIKLDVPEDRMVQELVRRHMPKPCHTSSGPIFGILEETFKDAYRRLLAPAIEREIRNELTEAAEAHAITVFSQNLRQLLMQPPLHGRMVLGVDPAYRTGCKLAVVDETGKLQTVSVIYPTPPANKVAEARAAVLELMQRFSITVIAIGNGTASRETEAFIVSCIEAHHERSGVRVPYVMVSEAGASVYSASDLAREEFPGLDVSERSAISIARRLQDPLAELVKIDPKSIGVGQYQHDVSQKSLDEQLGSVVESVVNQVGVDLNTASPSLLSYVSGLNRTVSRNIVAFREENGRFRTRQALSKVPRLGKKTLEQCIGFLRIVDGEDVLDATPIHPESYPVVDRVLKERGIRRESLRDAAVRQDLAAALREQPTEDLAARLGVGAPTLRDIVEALERPNRDPREDAATPILRTDILKLEDLTPSMELKGTVRNVVDFGAFVDVGIKNDGLVHISQIADRFVKHPLDVVSVGDVVRVRVVSVDVDKQRLGLSMKGVPQDE